MALVLFHSPDDIVWAAVIEHGATFVCQDIGVSCFHRFFYRKNTKFYYCYFNFLFKNNPFRELLAEEAVINLNSCNLLIINKIAIVDNFFTNLCAT